jgi:hypothetical protein
VTQLLLHETLDEREVYAAAGIARPAAAAALGEIAARTTSRV